MLLRRSASVLSPRRTLEWAIFTLTLAVIVSSVGCARPILTRDGKLLFAERGGTAGASVLTANGIEYMDDISPPPRPVARTSAHDPWRAPTGFLMPSDGIWRETSTPTPVAGHGMSLLVRPSDVLLPSWGGEILLRLDTFVPREAFPHAKESARRPLTLVLVVDDGGAGTDLRPLVEAATDGLGDRDRVAVVHSSPPRVVVPRLPGQHRTLVRAGACEGGPTDKRANLAAAIALADEQIRDGEDGRIAILTPGRLGASATVRRQIAIAQTEGSTVAVVASRKSARDADLRALGALTGAPLTAREDALYDLVPPPGDIVLTDVSLELGSVPAPARIIEPSAGKAEVGIDRDRLFVGDLYVGEARTDVVRVAVPPWVPGEPAELTVTVNYTDARDGRPFRARNTLHFEYSDLVARIAKKRHGDVIAYASALAMVRRLDRAFIRGTEGELTDLRSLVRWQARSLRVMARERHDSALRTQAEVLATLSRAIPE